MSDTSPSEPGHKDPSLDREIDDALSGVDLQGMDLPPSRGSAGRNDATDGLRPGTVTGVHGGDVFVELGPRMQGVIKLNEFDNAPQPGEVFEFSLHGQEDGLWVLSRRQAVVLSAWKDVHVGALVKATVHATNKGGLECQIGPLSAFMPASQADLHHVEDLSTLVGQSFTCDVTEVDRDRRRVVVSRRRVLEREQEESRAEVVSSLSPGQVVRGPVTRVEDFGAFVRVAPGVEGLVHLSNISRKRVENPRDVLEPGQEVEVMVLDIKEGGKRIGLGMKQLEPDPWDDAHHRFRTDSVVPGKVTRLAPFGAFVEIADGLEGLLHISQLGEDRRGTPIHKIVQEGQELSVRVQSVDTDKRRISLSRLDERGAIIGSEDAVESSEVDRVLGESQEAPLATNLGALFKKALKDPPA